MQQEHDGEQVEERVGLKHPPDDLGLLEEAFDILIDVVGQQDGLENDFCNRVLLCLVRGHVRLDYDEDQRGRIKKKGLEQLVLPALEQKPDLVHKQALFLNVLVELPTLTVKVLVVQLQVFSLAVPDFFSSKQHLSHSGFASVKGDFGVFPETK